MSARTRAVLGVAAMMLIAPVAPGQNAPPPRTSGPPPARATSGDAAPAVISGCAVEGVTDARTVRVMIDGVAKDCRLIGLLLPKGDASAARAAEAMGNLLRGENVTVVIPPGAGVDRDGAAFVLMRREPEGLDVSLEALRQGFALLDGAIAERFEGAITPAQQRVWTEAAQRAKDNRRGVWSPAARSAPETKAPPETKTPAETKAPPETSAEESAGAGAPPASAGEGVTVWATRSGSKYHREACRFARSADRLTLEEATGRKLEPCAVCKPDQR